MFAKLEKSLNFKYGERKRDAFNNWKSYARRFIVMRRSINKMWNTATG